MSTTVAAEAVAKPRSWPVRLLRSFWLWLGIVLVLVLVLLIYHVLADRHTPLTNNAYAQAYVVQIAPRVEGDIVAVHVKENDVVRQGQLLFEIDPRPYRHKVDRLRARLVRVIKDVAQLEAELAALKADDDRLDAEVKYADAVYAIDDLSHQRGALADEEYLEALRKKKTAAAAKARSLKLIRKAEEALAAQVDGEHSIVAETRAELAEAELNLGFTRVTAPADGVVTDLQLRVGSHVKIGDPVLTVIDTQQWFIVADFRESCLEHLAEGQSALVCFNNYPGRLFKARVFSVGLGVDQGQGVPSGTLPKVRSSSPWIRLAQRFQVRLVMDDAAAPPLRVGMRATVSVYCQRDGLLPGVTEKVHQVLAWLEYLF